MEHELPGGYPTVDDPEMVHDLQAVRREFRNMVEDNGAHVFNGEPMLHGESFRDLQALIEGFHQRYAEDDQSTVASILLSLRAEISKHRVSPEMQQEFRLVNLSAEVGRVQKRLVSLIDGLLESSPPQATIEPLEWKGDDQLLAWLCLELAEKGWLRAPMHRPAKNRTPDQVNASAFARLIADHFKGIKPKSIEQVLKPEGREVPGEDTLQWTIPNRLK